MVTAFADYRGKKVMRLKHTDWNTFEVTFNIALHKVYPARFADPTWVHTGLEPKWLEEHPEVREWLVELQEDGMLNTYIN